MEEKPFKRVTKRLLASNSLIKSPVIQLHTTSQDALADEGDQERQHKERRQFREDILLDFAAFESSIARIQFLLRSNERERERYAAEKLKILETAQAVRESTAQLHVRLAEARKTLAVRKTWDELTEKITNNRMLRPRKDQEANLERLNAEIADLEKESKEYAQTWAERRDQFGRIIKEGMELRRLIRDEKEEVERREGMEEREEREEGEEGEVETQLGEGSAVDTPRLELNGASPTHQDQNSDAQTETASDLLAVVTTHTSDVRSLPRHRSPRPSQTSRETVDEPEEGEDTAMTEQGEINEGSEDSVLPDAPGDLSRTGSAAISASPGKSPASEARLMDHRKGGQEVDGLEAVDDLGETMDTS